MRARQASTIAREVVSPRASIRESAASEWNGRSLDMICESPLGMHYTLNFMDPLVLTVDVAGLPQAWVALEEAITYHAKQMVAWSLGREVREFRGGWQRNGERSRIATKSILAIKGTGAGSHIHAPGLTNSMLFARDRQLCAYCGKRYLIRDLSRDHVVPVSRGGRDSWTNTVTACRSCNTRKGGRSPEQAHMPLLYVPYVPLSLIHISEPTRLLSIS